MPDVLKKKKLAIFIMTILFIIDRVHLAVLPNYNLLNHSINAGFQVDTNISH